MKFIYGHFPVQAPEDDKGTGGGGNGGGNATPTEAETLKAELENERKASREAKAAAESAKKELEDNKKLSLKTKEDYKGLSERLETEKNELLAKDHKRNKAFVHSARVKAVQDEATKLGLLPEAAKHIALQDLEDLEVEIGDDLTAKVKGAKEKAELIKKSDPFFFNQKQAPKVNVGGGQNQIVTVEGDVTEAQLKAAFSNRMRKPQEFRAIQAKWREQLSKSKQ